MDITDLLSSEASSLKKNLTARKIVSDRTGKEISF